VDSSASLPELGHISVTDNRVGILPLHEPMTFPMAPSVPERHRYRLGQW